MFAGFEAVFALSVFMFVVAHTEPGDWKVAEDGVLVPLLSYSLNLYIGGMAYGLG